MVINIILVIFFLWVLILTVFFLRLRRHYYNLIFRTKKRRIDDILDQLLAVDESFKKEINVIKKTLTEEIVKSKFYFQKIGLLRFNPFGRKGGEQSFVVALLDREKRGLVINFIYTPDGLRVYPKKIKEGKGEEYELSEEEKKVIEISK